MRRQALSALCLLLLASLATGCFGRSIRAQVTVVRQDIEKAKRSGAYRCAPKELAQAEAHSQFVLGELDQGDFSRAREHLQVAITSTRDALNKSVGCAPKQVVVAAPPPPPPAPPPPPTIIVQQRPDRDGDGVPDDEDKCPDTPGLPELQGCPEVKDTDGDGIPDETDKCPNDREDFDGDNDEDGCPDIVYDRDSDGLADDKDTCPDDPEDFDGFQDEDGCPEPDNDNDTLTDQVDNCPLEPGPVENQGCPVQDRDGDGIADDVDKCPDEAGVPEQQGCPAPTYKLIVINKESKKIDIKQKVHFATGRARIKSKSFGLLDEVAQALKDSKGLEILIEGHTDSVGSDAVNMRLSQKRADAVRQYMIDKGIAPQRMQALGFGETRPIASNKTSRGREKNRRVEFTITKYPN